MTEIVWLCDWRFNLGGKNSVVALRASLVEDKDGYIDTSSLDTEFVIAASIAALQVKNKPKHAVQVPVSVIARELGQLALIQKHLDKLPATAQVLAELVETREAFAFCCIQ